VTAPIVQRLRDAAAAILVTAWDWGGEWIGRRASI